MRRGILLCILAVCPHSLSQAEEPQGNITALVNGQAVGLEAVNRTYQGLLSARKREGKSPTLVEKLAIRQEALNSLILTELLHQHAKEKGLAASDAEVQRKMDELKDVYGSDSALEAALAREGSTLESLRRDLNKSQTAEKLMRETAEKETVSDKEVDGYYHDHLDEFKTKERIRVSQILIRVEPAADEDTEQKALSKIEGIERELRLGSQDFGDLADKYSEDPNKRYGGDLGYFGQAEMEKSFEEAAFGLRLGELSRPVRTSKGYHLIKCVDRKPPAPVPFDQVESMIRSRALQNKRNNAIKALVEELRARAKLEIFPLPDDLPAEQTE